MTSENTRSKRKNSKVQKEDEEVKIEEDQRVIVKKVPVIPKVTFSAWFEGRVKKRKLKYWQEEALEVFIKKQGLTLLEPIDSYEEVFKKY